MLGALATVSDVEIFVRDSSPHIKNVRVKVNEDSDFEIFVELHWFYAIFFSRTYLEFIQNKMEDMVMIGVNYYISVG